MLAGPLWLQGTLFLRGILDNSLHLVIALLFSWHKATASRGTQFPWFLGTTSDWGVLLHRLLLNSAHLLGPLGALGVGGVSRGLILTPLLNLSPTDLGALNITVLDKGSPADVGSLI